MRIAALALAFLLAAPAFSTDRPGDPVFQGRSPVVAANGMAATAHPLASQAAVDILRAGGSAVDAAIAANAVLGLVEPTGNGIGGDLFALIWDPATRKVVALDASGFAPMALDVAALQARHPDGQLYNWGMDSVTVPGAVAGWAALHQRYGRLPLSTVLAPAVALARSGFPVSPVIARGWAMNFRRFTREKARIEDADLAWQLYAPGGAAPEAGERFTNPDLAATLEMIGRDGAAAFYKGAFATDMGAHFARHGRAMAASDLARMEARWVTPISAPYRDVTVWQIPPATQGLATLQMLRILDRYDLKSMSEPDRAHLLIEAKKLAFADRARFIADPQKVKVPVAALLADGYIASRAALIRMDRAMPATVPAGDPERAEHSDTTYLTTADSGGMMVSLIQSNYAGMGSGIVVPRAGAARGTWGFMLQNRGAQFSLAPAAANSIAPGKRPFHTIIPGMATRGDAPWLAFGVMGGTMQPQGHAQILINLIDLGMNLQAAGDAPRIRHLGSPDPDGGIGDGVTQDGVRLETRFSDATRASLAARGHRLIATPEDVGGYQAIMWDAKHRMWWGASEMRKDGMALGY